MLIKAIKIVGADGRYLVTWVAITIFVLYFYSVAISIGTVGDIFIGNLPFGLAAYLFFELPLNVLRNTSFMVGGLFIVNTLLVGLYLTMLIYILRKKRMLFNRTEGVWGTVLVLIGTGCVACGATVAPFLIAAIGILIPLSLFAYFNEFVSIISLMILIYAVNLASEEVMSPNTCPVTE